MKTTSISIFLAELPKNSKILNLFIKEISKICSLQLEIKESPEDKNFVIVAAKQDSSSSYEEKLYKEQTAVHFSIGFMTLLRSLRNRQILIEDLFDNHKNIEEYE